MNGASFVSRLNRLNQQLITICRLGEMEEQSNEKGSTSEEIPERDVGTGDIADQKLLKLCPCSHHGTVQKPNSNKCTCMRTCGVPEENASCCPKVCKPRPRPCFCREPKTKGGERYSSKGSSTDDGDRSKTVNQDLIKERQRALELEEKLKDLTCSIKCLKQEGEQQATCLRESLQKAEEQAKLAARSRNLAMDLAKQSRDQTDMLKLGKDEMMGQISHLQQKVNSVACENSKLACECRDLKCKLKAVTENEVKKCAEVADEVGRIKCAVQKKEEALSGEKTELEEMIAELTNVVKIQKKRICELTGICNKQREALEQKESSLSAKNSELCELQCRVKTMGCKCREMKEEAENLKCCLDEEARACNGFKRELEDSKERHCCELRIKEKIIEDQNDTIKKLKKLVQESEKMAKQAAREFEQLTDQLYCERVTNNSLKAALETEEQVREDEERSSECKSCDALESELDCMGEEKQKAFIAAKFATQKLCESTREFQRQQECDKRQNKFLMLILQKKEEEIGCLKREVMHSRTGCAESRNNNCIN